MSFQMRFQMRHKFTRSSRGNAAPNNTTLCLGVRILELWKLELSNEILYRVLHIYLPPFWWLAISKPVDPEKSYIPLWKAVTSGCLKKLLNWKQIYDEKLQMSFSKSGRTLFSSFNFEDSLFLSQLTQERVIYLFRKPRIVVHETSFEIGGKPVMEGSRRVLVKLLLLQ